ncbi:MAG: acyl-CoA thioesterase [Vulcanimicrobiaceae bacterium]
MTSFEREPSSISRIRLRDCDAFGHLHNSRFIDYFMEAREDQLRACYDLDLVEHARKTGQTWLVTNSQIRYFAPAAYGSQVQIVTRLYAHDDARLHVEGRMYDSAQATLLALFWCTFRAVQLPEGRPSSNHGSISELLERVVYPIPESTFEERARRLRADSLAAR